jgi:hypothetical protein
VADCNPSTVIGEDAPVPVYPPGDEVTVNEVAAGDSAGKENVTVAAPLLNALPVPTFEADTPVGANGSRKSLDAAERLPVFLAIYNSLLRCQIAINNPGVFCSFEKSCS